MRPQPYTKKCMQLGNADNGGISFLQERAYQLVLQHQMDNPENASICVTSYRLSRLCLEIYMHIHNNECMRVTMNENGHEFERGKGGVYGKIWRKIKERRNGVII